MKPTQLTALLFAALAAVAEGIASRATTPDQARAQLRTRRWLPRYGRVLAG